MYPNKYKNIKKKSESEIRIVNDNNLNNETEKILR